jgi:hypothetical protein
MNSAPPPRTATSTIETANAQPRRREGAGGAAWIGKVLAVGSSTSLVMATESFG